MTNPIDPQLKALLDEFHQSNKGQQQQIIGKMQQIDSDQTCKILTDLLDDPSLLQRALQYLRQYYFKKVSSERKQALYDKLIELTNHDEVFFRREALKVLSRLNINAAELFVYQHELIKIETDVGILSDVIGAIDSIDSIPNNHIQAVIETLQALSDRDDLRTPVEQALKRLEPENELDDSTCSVCGRGQHEIRLRQCLHCKKVICMEHGHLAGLYCSEEHYVKHNQERHGSNPQNW